MNRTPFAICYVAIVILLCPSLLIAAQKRIAVLEFTNEAGLSSFEVETLADDVRAASLVLSPTYTVMTRESMMALLPPGTDLSKCSEAECEVQAGIKIGADLVVAGTVGRYAGDLVVRLKLFDTASAALIEQRTAEGANSKLLRRALEDEAKALFKKVRPRGVQRTTSPTTAGGRLGEQPQDWDLAATEEYVVAFESAPPGAMVEVDGELLCEAPCSRTLAKGRYTIEMKKLRYSMWTDDVMVSTNRTISGVLPPSFGWLSVRSEPAGKQVVLNGKVAGVTPIESRETAPGAYEVLVTDERFYDVGKRVAIEAGKRELVSVILKPKQGGLKVAAVDVAGNAVVVRVMVDGEEVGQTPWTAKWIIGPHELKVVAKDGREAKEKVRVVHQQVTTETLTLPAMRARRSRPRGRSKPGKAGIDWVSLPGGSFTMGSSDNDDEKPAHRVRVEPFEIAKTEVTVAQYRVCVEAGACSAAPTGRTCNWGNPDRDDHPVNCVDWAQARDFCRWAGGRLPSEAEWEYAARSGGLDQAYPWGNGEASCERATMDFGGNGCGANRTWPVCSKASGNSAQGVCDLAGNVWEWVEDWYHDTYTGAPADGSAWVSPAGFDRVRRGGGWNDVAGFCRAAVRHRSDPGDGSILVGFRPARSRP